jgi:hypothetical protein
MSFDLLDNVILLDLTLEAAKGVLESLALLKLYFRQTKNTSRPTKNFLHIRKEGTDIIGG